MSYNIRHIILPVAAAIACAVASCASDTEVMPPASQDEMVFEVTAGSRTELTTNDNIKDQPFMLFGDVNSSGAYFPGVKPVFHWEKVAYSDGKWNYTKATQYWFMGQEHSFVAIHPFIDPGDPQVTILTYEDSKLSFTYTLPEKLEDAKDLLFATHRRKYTLENNGPVYLQFTHLLPRINVSLALEEKELMYDHVDETPNTYNKNEFIQVHSIEFNGIKTRASFTFTALPLGGETSTYDYEKSYLVRDDDRVEDIRVTLKNPCKVPNSYKRDEETGEENYVLKYVVALQDSEIVVMLPQSFDDDSDATMVINYSINEDNDLMRRIVIPLKGTTWKEGMKYTYKLLIDNCYYNHIVDPSKISIDIDDFRLPEEGDDSWITDDEDEDHNIGYKYDNQGNCGPYKEE